MKQNQNSCAFTGHRPSKLPWRYNEADARCLALKTELTKQIKSLIEAGITNFFCGMAEGTDCYCAQIVLDLRKMNPTLKLNCVLPCEGQDNKWSESAKEQYRTILNQADSIEYVSRNYYDGCMLDRNRRLVEQAGVLLAVFNGVQRSGTGATVRHARKMGREIIVINPVTQLITREGPL